MKIFGSNAQWLDESILPPLISAAEQLAVDEAMLNEAEKGLLQNSVVRTWQAATPVVVLHREEVMVADHFAPDPRIELNDYRHR